MGDYSTLLRSHPQNALLRNSDKNIEAILKTGDLFKSEPNHTLVPSEDALWAEHLKESLNSETYGKFSKLGFFTRPEDWEA